MVQAQRGRAASLLVIGATVLVALAVQELCVRLPLGWLLLGIAMSTLVAARGLYDHVAAVATGLEHGLEQGREAVAHIVGRDPASLDAHGVARAAIESTAENFADGVVAPLFWGVLLGLPGMAAYKAINTLDSMIGHRSPRYVHFGRFAARLDDVANWLPARFSAFLILARRCVCPAPRRRRAGGRCGAMPLAIARRMPAGPRRRWPALSASGLAGPRRYGGEPLDDAWMGDGRAAATVTDIRRALRLLVLACVAAAALLVVLALFAI